MVVGAFGVPNLWNEVDGKLVSRVEDPRYLDYIRYMKSLYQEGLLDKEFPVNKSATLSEKFSSGRAGIIPITYSEAGTISNALAKNSQGAELTFLDAVSGKNGEMGIGTGESFSGQTGVHPQEAVHPEDAVKYMDAKLDEETFKLVAIGREGEHYKVEDGEYIPSHRSSLTSGSANNYLTGINEGDLSRLLADPGTEASRLFMTPINICLWMTSALRTLWLIPSWTRRYLTQR